MSRRTSFGVGVGLGLGLGLAMWSVPGFAQAAGSGAVQEVRQDAALEAAQSLVGRALILRCFCADNNLDFDADGHPRQAVKGTDWTLAGVKVQKVERRDSGTLELDGVRVAIRFAPDRREFDRHPLNDEKVKLLVEDTGQGASFARTLDLVFAEGLDLRLQRAMPAFWQHYFIPQTAWPKDGLDGQTIVTPGAQGAPAGLIDPKPVRRAEASYTPEATHDRVQGSVVLRMVVDTAGVPQRITVTQPLGYGLDARAAQAIEKYRFAPAMTSDGKTVASHVQVRQEFSLVQAPRQ